MKKPSILLLAALSLGGYTLLAQTPAAPAGDKVDFEKQIFPIFKEKCLKCHESEHTDATGKLKKPKGGLIMDSIAGLKKGGKESAEKTLIAGNGAESSLYKVTTLPSSDDMAMPPEGKGDPLTDAEKALLKKWIDGGADFGTWKGK
ncbi:MAG: c-type cytochrome domain-containing protein [Verrucomicrobium sp.]|nr:c-type cytochrome domain-containing protein [Verrucomicrobium sp.]